MSTLNIIAAHNLPSPSTSSSAAQSHKPNSLSLFFCTQASSKPDPPRLSGFPTRKKRSWIVGSVTEDREVVPLKEKLAEEQDSRLLVNGSEEFQALSTSSEEKGEGDDLDKLTSRAINALIVLGFGTFAVSKLLTIDHDYWHGWTLYEILRYVPEHNWIAYEQALKANPVFAKMAGWKLWPFAHVVTYGLIPVEQRLLWVDCVELIWVTILSTYSNENADSSLSEASSGADSASSSSSSSKD